MPKLWNETIEGHRREVSEAILETTVGLVSTHGLLAVTMSQIADETGIGRATLYKYFPDVESILVAWHQRQVARHVAHLAEVREAAGSPFEQLEAVLGAYALISRERHSHHDGDIAAVVHRDEHVAGAERELHALLRELVVAASKQGRVRDDVPPGELVTYALHALAGAGDLRSKAAVRRLVAVTVDGLRPST